MTDGLSKTSICPRLPVYSHKIERTCKLFNGKKSDHYIWILAPPNSGSSMFLNLLASSPHTTTLCRAREWRCEGTWLFFSKKSSAHSRFSSKINWVKVFEKYNQYWEPNKFIKLDKSPPFICHCNSLESYLCKNNLSATFLIAQDEYEYCFHKHTGCGAHRMYQKCLTKCRRNSKCLGIRRVYTSYSKMIMNPIQEMEKILTHVPELECLNPHTTHIPHMTSIGKYIQNYKKIRKTIGENRSCDNISV